MHLIFFRHGNTNYTENTDFSLFFFREFREIRVIRARKYTLLS